MKKILVAVTILITNLYSFSQEPVLNITQPTCFTPNGTAEVTFPVYNPGALAQNLFISEVTDANAGGLSYIEIYNGTGNTVDLSNYKLKIISNGSSTPTCDFTLSGSVTTSNVFVIAVGSPTNQGGVIPNLTLSACPGFNTNDAVILATSNDTSIDLWGSTIGTTFTPLGLPGYTYRRHADAPVPSTTWNPSDWNVLDPEDYTNVGTYAAAVSYSYSLDGGPGQMSTVFFQVSIGQHTISAQNNNTGDITQTAFDIVPVQPNLPVTNFIYPSPACKRDFLLSPNTPADFSTGGAFVSMPPVVINPNSGFIDLNLTPPGSYIVSYVVQADLALCTLSGSSSFNITILPTSETPIGNTNQTIIVPNPTIMNLIVSPTNVTWYSSYNNAINQTNPLIDATPLVDGATYYAMNNDLGCQSDPLPVTVQLVLSNTTFTDFTFAIVPNPVDEILHIQTANQAPIDKIIISDLSGKTVLTATSVSNEVAVDRLAAGMYLIEVFSNNQKWQSKLIKR